MGGIILINLGMSLGALIDQCNLPAVRSKVSSFVHASLPVRCTILFSHNGAKFSPLIGLVVALIFLSRTIDMVPLISFTEVRFVRNAVVRTEIGKRLQRAQFGRSPAHGLQLQQRHRSIHRLCRRDKAAVRSRRSEYSGTGTRDHRPFDQTPTVHSQSDRTTRWRHASLDSCAGKILRESELFDPAIACYFSLRV